MDKYCPTEDVEEARFSSWCDERKYLHWHVPQETYTTSWKQKAHNKSLGVKAGVSDHWVKIPTPNRPWGVLVVIEFKRQFGNTPTDEQIAFLNSLDTIDNIAPVCCYGCDEAIKMVEELEDGVFTTYDACWERMKKIEENRKNRQKSPKKRKKSENDLPY